MLAVSNGSLFALATPAGKRGWQRIGISIKSTERSRIDSEFLQRERQALGPPLFRRECPYEFPDAKGPHF